MGCKNTALLCVDYLGRIGVAIPPAFASGFRLVPFLAGHLDRVSLFVESFSAPGWDGCTDHRIPTSAWAEP